LSQASLRASFTGTEVRLTAPDEEIAAIFRAALAETDRPLAPWRQQPLQTQPQAVAFTVERQVDGRAGQFATSASNITSEISVALFRRPPAAPPDCPNAP
jgi:hypothetical protein